MDVDKKIIDFLKTQKKVKLGFSTGRDSVVCASILKKLEVEFTPFYFFYCPDLEFIDNNIKLYEKHFGINIVQMPHPCIYDVLRHQDFQPKKMAEWLDAQQYPALTFDDLMFCHYDSIGEDCSDYYGVTGVRAAESFNRRMLFKNSDGIDIVKRKVFPIYNWKVQDCRDYMLINKIPTIPDYKIWNRSYDVLSYRFLVGVKKHYPKDWLKLLEYFPLLECEIFRYEQNKKYF